MRQLPRWKSFRDRAGGWRFALLAGSIPLLYSANRYRSRRECEEAIEGVKSTRGQ